MPDRLALALIVGLLATGSTAPGDEAPRTFTFVCLDDATGKPIPGVTIRAYLDYEYRFLTTDADGSAAVPRPEKHYNYTVDSWKEGYVQERKTWSDIDDKRKPLPERFESRMKAGVARIGGRVVDEQGRPVAGAVLHLYESPPYRKVWKGMMSDLPVTTDADGRWTTASVPPETCPIHGRVEHPEYRDGRLDRPLTELLARRGDVVLKKGSVVEGRVLGPDGKPVAGAKVHVGDRSYRPETLKVRTDEEGRYRLANLEPGANDIVVLAPGLAIEKDTITAGAEPARADFRLEPGRKVRGVVVNAAREPIVGASVRLMNWRGLANLEWWTRTDGQGRFAWDSAPEDAFEINLSETGYAGDARTVRPGEEEVRSTLKRSIAIHGAVTDAKTGAKVPRIEFAWGANMPPPPPLPGGGMRINTHLWGTYYAEAIDPPDRFTFTIEAQGYRPFTSREFLANEPFVTYDVKLQKLAPGEGSGPAGVVLAPDGKPAAGAEVLLASAGKSATLMNGEVHPTEGHMSFSGAGFVTADDDGSFIFSPTPGAAQLAVVHPLGFAQVASEDLAKSPKITLKPWGRIEGRIAASLAIEPTDRVIVWSDSGPVVGRDMINASYQNIKVDADRRFTVERVTPGPMRVEFTRHENLRTRPLARTAHLMVGEGQTAHITLGEGGRGIVVKFALPDDLAPGSSGTFDPQGVTFTTVRDRMPVPVEVLLKGDEARFEWLRAWQNTPEGRAIVATHDSRPLAPGPDGTFRADDVMPGDYYVMGKRIEPGSRRGEPLAMAWARVTVPDGPPGSVADLGSLPMRRMNRPADGTLAPPIVARTLDGKPFFLDDLRGKNVVVNFWRSDHDNCRAQAKTLLDLAAAHAAKGDLEIVNVSLDADPEAARKFVAEAKLPGLQITLGDWGSTPTPAAYGVADLPYSFVLGPDGSILGTLPAFGNQLVDQFDRVLKKAK